MAYLLSILLAVVAVFAKKSEAIGGIQERFERLPAKQELINEENPSYNENINNLAAILKKDTLTVLCDSGKVNPVWCGYKQLLALNNGLKKQQKTVKRKRAAIPCWPGIPISCKGVVPVRHIRAADNEINDDEEINNIINHNNIDHIDNNIDEEDEEIEEIKRALKCRPGMVNCQGKKGKRDFFSRKTKHHVGNNMSNNVNMNNTDNDEDEIKRALKCRPGMVNCRRKKKGKRDMSSRKTKHCPQGWMYCNKKSTS